VPALLLRLLPWWLSVLGIALAALGELSALSLIVPPALLLIPLTRLPGFVWLSAAGFKLSPRQAARSTGVSAIARARERDARDRFIGASPAAP
jgi:hypothetical protein